MKFILLISASLFMVASVLAATQGILVDRRDGEKYKTVKIGSQVWMAENLNFETQTSSCYDYEDYNCSEYGQLYSWSVAKKVCPSGWHLPSKAEFETLIESVGGMTAGLKLKSKTGWENNGNGSDDFGFSALPGGVRYAGSGFCRVGEYTGFWSSTKSENHSSIDYNVPVVYIMYFVNDNVFTGNFESFNEYYVRCIKDRQTE